MNSQKDIIDRFKNRWNKNNAPVLATTDDISRVEKALDINFPDSYKYLISNYGDLYTPEILNAITDNSLDLVDVQNFTSLAQTIEDTKAYEDAGMPKGFIAFANDCMGNLFCFCLNDCNKDLSEPAVWFFDHDFVEMKKIFPSFLQWLDSYKDL